MEKACENCGKSFKVPPMGRPKRFCHARCQVMASRRRRSAGLPSVMVKADRWVNWKPIRRGERWTKMPVQPNGRAASSTDPSTWTSFTTARGISDRVGFVLGDGIGCIDLDGAIVDGEIQDWAQEVLDANRGTFVEVSQSGKGLHVWGFLPEMPGRVIRDGRSIEVYSQGRYIALGTPFPGAPLVLKDLVL